MDVLVFGGYGTFGSHVSRELARRGVRVIVAGRDQHRAQRLAAELGPPHRALAADLANPAGYRSVLAGQPVIVNCAGPFSAMNSTLLEECLAAGCHYTDIGEDRNYARLVRSYGHRFAQQGLCAVFGCSSLPAISGALALLAASNLRAPALAARVTLFIGNRSPKGRAAIQSAVSSLGKAIAAPQGVIDGFRDGERVRLPAPFGQRRVYNFDSPDYDLLPPLLGLQSLVVKVGFESQLATRLFATLAALSSRWGSTSARVLYLLGTLTSGWGSSGGVVLVELFDGNHAVQRAALVAQHDGQRMAALPCILVAHALCQEPALGRGALTAYELLGAKAMLAPICDQGFDLVLS